jgi:hypothetical protein
MSAENVIENLQKIVKEKKVPKSEHRWKWEEEAKLLQEIKTKKEL